MVFINRLLIFLSILFLIHGCKEAPGYGVDLLFLPISASSIEMIQIDEIKPSITVKMRGDLVDGLSDVETAVFDYCKSKYSQLGGSALEEVKYCIDQLKSISICFDTDYAGYAANTDLSGIVTITSEDWLLPEDLSQIKESTTTMPLKDYVSLKAYLPHYFNLVFSETVDKTIRGNITITLTTETGKVLRARNGVVFRPQ